MTRDVVEMRAPAGGERSQGEILKGVAAEPDRPTIPNPTAFARSSREEQSRAAAEKTRSTAEYSEEIQEEKAGRKDPMTSTASSTSAAILAEPAARLPRRIEGGFRGVGDELDLRAREWRNMVRILEHHRPQLEIAELERDRLFSSFAKLAPEVEQSGQELKEMISAMKDGDISGELSPRFARNLKVLDDLESLAGSMTSNLLALRSAWEQYARSIIQAEMLRSQLRQADGDE